MKTIEWLASLVACDTTSRHSNLQLINLVSNWMIQNQIPVRITYDETLQKANLLATIPAADGSFTGGIILSGHTDVVPVDNQAWETNPFEITEKKDKIFGRGTADMKGFLAVILAFVPKFKQLRLSKPIHLAFSYDEEVGCKGVPFLIKDMQAEGIAPAVCIVGEPTEMQPIVAHKGMQVYQCRFYGHSAHSSLTTQGCNAIDYAAQLINFLRNLAERFKQNGPFDQHYDVPFTTISTNIISGGTATNIIPALCDFNFEFRHLPQVSPKSVLDEIERYIQVELLPQMKKDYKDASIEIENIAGVPGFETDKQHLINKIMQILNPNLEPHKVAYATEAGLFQAAHIPTIVCGPGNIEQAHKANEFITLDQLNQCEDFLLKVVNLFKI